jgi:nucleoside-diphosphate-sugar epimerase
MKLLIAGGAGYLGSALVPRLLERGYDVTVVDMLWFGNRLPPETRLIEKNVFDLKVSDLSGQDQALFLAGLSNDPMAEYSPSRNFVSNAAAPAYFGFIAKQADVRRCIFGSSCSVYGYSEDELFDETKPAVSTSPYGISKLMGEQSLLQLVDDTFSVISLRKGTVCGYSPRMRLDLVVNTMFKTALQGREIVIRNPAIWRPILSIQDAVGAYLRAVEAVQSVSGVFNIASDNYTVGEVGDIVKETLEALLNERIALNIQHQQEFRNYKVDCTKAMHVLSFKPAHDVAFIVKDLFDNREKFQDLDNPLYYNIEVFKKLYPEPD